ncbi:type I-C CRISPR-associated protein Cas8c/Csd1 [Methanospirillum sp.]|uniref:type I-C CRISPR-associated protein Cas8c/Csd1 n=2 Tax=Methanospirillum sp. TaxID=45200 RepID=UPI001BD5E324
MIIQALNQYYDILTDDENCSIPRKGYSTAKVSFVLNLSKEGQLNHIIDIRTKEGKSRPKELVVPKQDSRSGAGCFPYFLCDNEKNVFGIEYVKKKDREKILNDSSKVASILEDDGENAVVVTKRSKKCFEAFRSLHQKILEKNGSVESKALLSFLSNWKPEDFLKHPKIIENKDEILKGVFFVFEVDGTYLHKSPELKKAWEMNFNVLDDEKIKSAQCLVSGKTEPISRVHQKIKGVTGAQSAGASLISFDKASFCSYEKEQSFNAPVGTAAEFKYTTVLNHLLADPKNRLRVADSTVIFWAETSDKEYEDLTLSLFNPPLSLVESSEKNAEQEEKKIKDEKTLQLIRDILTKVRNGQPLDPKTIGADPDTRFYILGLSPNNARLAVRFWYRDTYGEVITRIARHHLDLEIVKADFDPPYLSIYRLLKETIPKSAERGEASPILGGLMLNAVLNGSQYPIQMYYAIINRIKVERSINFARAGFIKAYLLRISRNGSSSLKESLITMSLNKESLNVPYRLGRLFAVLEKVQSETNKEMGSTITSKYFSSASATPAVVFPVLLKLAQHHIAKSDWGVKTNKDIEEILSGVDAFPAFLNLEEQGMFMLGFYHQKQAFYEKKVVQKEE